MAIRDLFVSDVTRDIPPVVYFHEQKPEKVADEVSEYIVTGGWPEGHPNRRRVPNGIHEQYVRLLTGIAGELDKTGGPELPASWISGFYGSGKSIFAKLLGLSLDGLVLPDGMALAEALLRRDTSPRAAELRDAWRELRERVDPLAVVFDIGSVARDNEPIHSAAVRQVQKRLGYCTTDPLVAQFELNLERDGEYDRFEQVAQQTLGQPWSEVKDRALAEEDFSLVMSAMFPDHYTDPMSWYATRAGSFTHTASVEEATRDVADMLAFREPGKTLFVVIDEVSQYIHDDDGRMLALQSFVSDLGQRLKGRVWLLVTGQQKLEEAGDAVVLGKMKDRFPPRLRVHLDATNIRDVVHRRLLEKTGQGRAQLRGLFEAYRQNLKLFAYKCDSITEEDFVEVYPLLPEHFDLLMQITSALRARSTRSQGDDQAIRGLLQLLGELFRDRKLADQRIGTLVTLDQIYEIQQSALDSDVQASMARILAHCAGDEDGLKVRAAKAVALLELIQDVMPTDAKLVASCLYDHLESGDQRGAISEALEELRRDNLLGYSEKYGYKIQSTAGEEWERDRRDIGVPREQISQLVQDALKLLLAAPDQPKLKGRPFPWEGRYSDARRADDVDLKSSRDDASIVVDLRFLTQSERSPAQWIKRSDETALRNRLLWVCGDVDQVDELARELGRSRGMVQKYRARRESLNAARKLLLQQEENRAEELVGRVRAAVDAAWMDGRVYFRGREMSPRDLGNSFSTALEGAGNRVLAELFPHFDATRILPGELLQLIEPELNAPSTKFLGSGSNGLGLLELDAGRYVSTCPGVVPGRVLDFIEQERGVGGSTLLSHFGRPPYGYTANVVRACVAGLLRASKIKVQAADGTELTAVRDAGVRDLFEKDGPFKQATFFPAGEDDIGFKARARICRFFADQLNHTMDREDHAIADAVSSLFPGQLTQLRSVLGRLNQLPDSPPTPGVLAKLEGALEDCIRTMRQTLPTVRMVRRHLDALRDGIQMLATYDAELTHDAIAAVRDAADVRDFEIAQLRDSGSVESDVAEAAERVVDHLELERPWRDVIALEPDVELIRDAYRTERRYLLSKQEEQAEEVRARVRARDGFKNLTADQAHTVLRPIASAVTDTTAEAVAPPLSELREPFETRLRKAEAQANDLLDELQVTVTVKKINLGLRNREIESKADIEALVSELRRRLEEALEEGVRLRLL